MALTMNDAKAIKNLIDLERGYNDVTPAFTQGQAISIRNDANRVIEKIEREAQGRKNIAHMTREEREESLGFSEASRKHGERVRARQNDNPFANLA